MSAEQSAAVRQLSHGLGLLETLMEAISPGGRQLHAWPFGPLWNELEAIRLDMDAALGLLTQVAPVAGWTDSVPNGYRDDLWVLVRTGEGKQWVEPWEYIQPYANDVDGSWLDANRDEFSAVDIAELVYRVKPNPRPSPPAPQPATSASRKSGSQSCG